MKNLGLTLVLLTCGVLASGQNYLVQINKYSIEDGLSSPVVNEVTKDDRGFLWVATKGGIDRFDGMKFRPYFRNEVQEATGVLTDNNGLIWVFQKEAGSNNDQVIDLIKPHSEEFVPFSEVYPNAGEYQPKGLSYWMATDKQIFLGGYRTDLEIFSDGKFHNRQAIKSGFNVPITWSKKHGAFAYSLRSPGDDPSGTIWHFKESDTLAIGPVYLGNIIDNGCIGVSEAGNLVYTAGHPLDADFTDLIYEYHQDSLIVRKKLITTILGHQFERFSDLVFKHNPYNDESWLFHNDSLYIIDQYLKIKYRGKLSDDEAHSSKITTVYFENERVAWVCGQRGLIRVSTNKLRFSQLFTRRSTGPLNQWGSNACRQIFEADSFLILATDNGILKLQNGGEFKYLSGENSVSLGFEFKDGKLKYCEHLKLLSQDLNTSEIETLTLKDHQFPHNPWMIRSVEDSVVYVAAKMMSRVDLRTGQVTEFNPWENGDYKVGHVYQIQEFKNQHLLATDAGAFVFNVESGSAKPFSSKSGKTIDNPHVHAILPVNDGLWFSTADTGLLHWSSVTDSIQHFGREEGLPSDVVYAALKDDLGFVWVSTDNGLSRFNPTDKTFKNYGTDDGLSEFEFNRNSYHKGASGVFYFGTVDGVNFFDPKDFWEDSVHNNIPMQVIGLTQDVSDSNKVVNVYSSFLESGTITLGPFDKFFIIEFNLLNYQSRTHSFAYIIDGIDEDWNYIDQNSIRISGLAGGNYTLRVRGQLDDGTWSKNQLSIPLVIRVPFYETPLFISLSLFFILIGFVVLIKWRTARLRRKTLELETIVATRTSELDTSLKQKEVLLKEIHHRVKNNLQVISSLLDLQSNRLTDEETKGAFLEGQNRVRSIALIHQQLYQNDHLSGIEIKEFSETLFEQIRSAMHRSGMQVDFQFTGDKTMFDIDTAVPLGLILNELITNSFKYAVSSNSKSLFELQLIAKGEGRFSLEYSDGGPGIPTDIDIKKVRSLGLRLIHRLSRQLGGSAIIGKEGQPLFLIEFLNTAARNEIA